MAAFIGTKIRWTCVALFCVLPLYALQAQATERVKPDLTYDGLKIYISDLKLNTKANHECLKLPVAFDTYAKSEADNVILNQRYFELVSEVIDKWYGLLKVYVGRSVILEKGTFMPLRSLSGNVSSAIDQIKANSRVLNDYMYNYLEVADGDCHQKDILLYGMDKYAGDVAEANNNLAIYLQSQMQDYEDYVDTMMALEEQSSKTLQVGQLNFLKNMASDKDVSSGLREVSRYYRKTFELYFNQKLADLKALIKIEKQP